MKILYLLKEQPNETIKKIMQLQREKNEIVTIDLRKEKDYDRIVEEIVTADKVISC